MIIKANIFDDMSASISGGSLYLASCYIELVDSVFNNTRGF